METNPYAAPPDTSQSESEQRPKWKQAKLAWLLPVMGVLLAMAVGNLGRHSPVAGQVAMLLAWACLIGGFVYTILGFVFSRKYSNALPHAIGGCATLLAFCALCVAAFVFVARIIQQQGYH